MSRFTWLAAVLGLTCPLLALARPADPTAEMAQGYADQALELASSPRGAAALIRMHGLIDDLEDITPLAATYAQVAGKRNADPGTRATATMLLMDLEHTRSRTVHAAELARSLGFINDFYVVGGFENEGKSGCDTDFGPEAASLDLSAKFAGAKGREVSWRKLAVTPVDGYVDLAAAVRPNKEAVAYALTWLEAPADTQVALGVGTSGGFRLWVNGQVAAREDRYNLPRPDQTRVSVHLRKGLNRVLLKVCQESGPLGFYLRQEPLGGRVTVHASLPATPPAVERGAPPSPQALPTLTSSLKALVEKKPDDAALRGDYATVLSFFRAFDERQHTATAESELAAKSAPNDVSAQLLAASNEREDRNLRRQFLEAALKAAPDSAQARVALAEHQLEHGHADRVPPLLNPVVQKDPNAASALLTLARAYESLGEGARAQLMVEEAFHRLPRIPRVVRAAAASSRKLERTQEVLDRLRVALALRYDDSASRRMLAAQLADMGQVDAAEREYTTQLALSPFDNDSRVRLGELRAANGHLDTAAAAFAEARALSPDEPEVYEREGRALLAAGRRDDALAAMERSLALRPQNPSLREAVRTLKGELGHSGSRFLVEAEPYFKEADAYPTEDAVYLVDSTYVRVQKNGLTTEQHQLVVKVLNQRGVEDFRTQPVAYSPDRQEVFIMRARVTKPDGSIIESYGDTERNINEPWTGMYYDARAKMLNFPALAPGDVLELQYRIEDTAQDNLLSDYYGMVQNIQGVYPKVLFQYMVDMPKERTLYSNSAKVPGVTGTQEELEGARLLYRWKTKNVPKVVAELGMPGWAEVAVPLHVSTYKTWNQLSHYWWGLVRDQLTPNDELRRTVDRVLTGVDRKDDMAVVRAIYNFVVTNTRYVALEFGIHGYKPYRVDQILARRFGDCKDKASLIHAMLKLGGIDSRMVLLRMRNLGNLTEDVPSLAAFNHAIVYVPKYKLFLDGTAEFHNARELPSADHRANALIVEPDGTSNFLITPESDAQDNSTRLTMDVTLKPDGSAEVIGASTVTGQTAPEYRRAYRAVDTRRSTFERAWAQSFPGLKVTEVKLNDTTVLDNDVNVDFRMSIPRYSEVLATGALRFLPFGAGRTYQQAYATQVERRFDLVMQGPWTNTFTLRYTLPAGYTVAELPPPLEESLPYGKVRLTYRQEGGKLIADGEVTMPSSRIKADDYTPFRDFLGRVDQAFGRKVVLQGPPQGKTAER
jgi:tetratricopeptide (TPR) repeat protein